VQPGLRDPARRLRHAGRAVRGGHAHPDQEGEAVPGDPGRRGRLLGRPHGLDRGHDGAPRQGARGRGADPPARPHAAGRAAHPRATSAAGAARPHRTDAGRQGDPMSRPCRVTLIPGDGIGPEVTAAAVRELAATGIPFEWETHQAGASAIGEHGTPLPPLVLESIRRNKVALKGPTETPVATGHRSVNVELRKQLDLYANLRPVQSLPGVKSRYEGVDLVVVRENTEDLYSGLEHVVVPGVVESLKIITEKASTRIARFAFDYSRTHARQKVSAVHKANIMKLSDGLFLDCCRKVAKEYADVAYDEIIVDNACMQLVLDPS